MSELAIHPEGAGVSFKVKVVPGSSRTAISGILDGMLKVKVAAVAEKGKANKGLIEFLAEQLGIRKNAISIISGQTNPVKIIHITGISAERLAEKLGISHC